MIPDAGIGSLSLEHLEKWDARCEEELAAFHADEAAEFKSIAGLLLILP
jgi:hypothetical protein